MRLELLMEEMSDQIELMKNEAARYELTENQNAKLEQDLEMTRLERESIRKTLEVLSKFNCIVSIVYTL